MKSLVNFCTEVSVKCDFEISLFRVLFQTIINFILVFNVAALGRLEHTSLHFTAEAYWILFYQPLAHWRTPLLFIQETARGNKCPGSRLIKEKHLTKVWPQNKYQVFFMHIKHRTPEAEKAKVKNKLTMISKVAFSYSSIPSDWIMHENSNIP